MSTRDERAQLTRSALLAAARELFGARGYGAVSMEEIVALAGVTRGALYHHFAGKPALFEAVFEELDTEFLVLLTSSMEEVSDPFESLLLAGRIFLDACLDANLVRLALLDAPTVLGWPRWREIQLKHGLGVVLETFGACMAAGQMHRHPIAPLSHMYFATLMEMGMYMANSADPAAARVEVEGILTDWLLSLRVRDRPGRVGPSRS